MNLTEILGKEMVFLLHLMLPFELQPLSEQSVDVANYLYKELD